MVYPDRIAVVGREMGFGLALAKADRSPPAMAAEVHHAFAAFTFDLAYLDVAQRPSSPR